MRIDLYFINNNGEKINYDYKDFLENINGYKDFKSNYKFEKMILKMKYGYCLEIYLDINIEELENILCLLIKNIVSEKTARKLGYCLEAYNNDIEFIIKNLNKFKVIDVADEEDFGRYMVFEEGVFGDADDTPGLLLDYVDFERIGREYKEYLDDYIKVKGAYVKLI